MNISNTDVSILQYYLALLLANVFLPLLQKAGTEFEIDSDMKTLHFYSIEDGDQILVRWS